MKLPITVKTDYMAIDLHIEQVVINSVFEDEEYIMCDLYTKNEDKYTLVCSGACYWYDGANKNIPFNWSPA